MKQTQTYYWYDYETFGNRPSMDWPAQFAGIRTDKNFNEVEAPLELFCRLPQDQLPQPQACLITGLTPQAVNEKGLCEAEFIAKINQVFSQPGTCVVGYNSLKFDDEVTRYSLYRNFLDSYAREWKNGNSRWDLIDTVRLCAALRPEGVEWPLREDGAISFKLEALTAENGIGHSEAHNAVSDVRATIELAKLIRSKQPKMFDYVLDNKDKFSAAGLLDLSQQKPVVHISGRFSSEKFCLAVVMPLAVHPTKKNEIIVYDLSVDPQSWMNLPAEEIRHRLFSTREVLEKEGLARIPIKTVWLNRCPVLVPFSVLRPEDKQRLGIGQSVLEKHYEVLKGCGNLTELLHSVFSERKYDEVTDPDQMLYSGGFFGNEDRKLIQQVSSTLPEQLMQARWVFKDERLPEMLFRYRARNWPQTLSEAESLRWKTFCSERLIGIQESVSMVSRLAAFQQEIAELLNKETLDEQSTKVLHQLSTYGQDVEKQLKK